MTKIMFIGLAAGCLPVTAAIDISGDYYFDPRHRSGDVNAGSFEFIGKDAVPFSMVRIRQDGRSKLTITCSQNGSGGPAEKTTAYDLQSRDFSCQPNRIVFKRKDELPRGRGQLRNNRTTEVVFRKEGARLRIESQVVRKSFHLIHPFIPLPHSWSETKSATLVLPPYEAKHHALFDPQRLGAGTLCAHFNSDEDASVLLPRAVRLVTPYTISAWAYLRTKWHGPSLPSYNACNGNTILMQGSHRIDEEGVWNFVFNVNANNKLGFASNPNPGMTLRHTLEVGEEFPLDQWVFVAVTHDGREAALYQDGKPADKRSGMSPGDAPNMLPTVVAAAFYPEPRVTPGVVYHDGTVFNSRWDGFLQSVTLHDRILSAKELHTLTETGPERALPEKYQRIASLKRKLASEPPTKEALEQLLSCFRFDSTAECAYDEALAMLRFVGAKPLIGSRGGDLHVMGLLDSGYEMAIWLSTYRKPRCYGIRYGRADSHGAYYSNNNTYIEICK